MNLDSAQLMGSVHVRRSQSVEVCVDGVGKPVEVVVNVLEFLGGLECVGEGLDLELGMGYLRLDFLDFELRGRQLNSHLLDKGLRVGVWH